MRVHNFFLASLAATSLAACATNPNPEADDPELAGAATGDGKADSLFSTSTFYTVTPDARKCASPACGGSFVRRVNRATTLCADGNRGTSCYVASIDYSPSGLTADGMRALSPNKLVLRGKLRMTDIGGSKIGELLVTEAWLAADSNPDDLNGDAFYRVTDSGVRCVTSPCPSLHQAKLNSTLSKNINDLDLSSIVASDQQKAAAIDAAQTPAGTLIVGFDNGETLVASEIYSRVACAVDNDCPKVVLGAACRLCSDGSAACPGNLCVANQCNIGYPACSSPPHVCQPSDCAPPAPAAPTQLCSDGSTAGPTCAIQSDASCGWTITTCP